MFKKRNIRSKVKSNAVMRKSEDGDVTNAAQGSDAEPDDEAQSEDETVVVRKRARKQPNNPMIQKSSLSTSNANRTPHSDSGASDDDNGAVKSHPKPLVDFTFKSSRSGVVSGPEDQGATATVEIDTEHDRDHKAIYERKLLAQETGEASSHIYTGSHNYTMFNKPKEKPTGVKAALKGPVRAPAFFRVSTRWDYAPDICKDYKETGFCGFGDSCKFLHDRSDYKFGWQLENEHAEQQKGKRTAAGKEDASQYEIDSDEEHLPFKCLICRESFVNPVVTKCKHYFCEKCALSQCRKSMRCFACGIDTKGMFNPAKEIIARISKGCKATEVQEDEQENGVD